ncbi:uncharacterized protein LOC131934573 [Physella acuta]|uniref:uncharacterized protein LOC131934573 n=1 Tax=Physella acuta TaxID=109671 RepID=UPI0027DB00E3|nr:uncharacterized protein LOC131934573 [Physella acuta]
MPSNMFFLFFFFVILASIEAGAGISLLATPGTLVIGLTKTLEVKCQTTTDGNSSFASLISLIVSRKSGNSTVSKELCTINVFNQNGQAVDVSDENITVSGKIGNNGVSYLSLVWENPDFSQAGEYKCEGNGVDAMGHPVLSNTTTMVTSSIADDDTVTNHVQNLTSKIDHLTSLVEEILAKQDATKTKLEVIKNTVFKISSLYHGSRYLLSPLLNTIIDKHASAMCQLFNGYLAEIDSSSEFQFVVDFVYSDPRYSGVLLGATDEHQEDVWVNRHSQTPAGYLHWAPGSPKFSRLQNCLYLWYYGRTMIDGMCEYVPHDFSSTYGYLCEVQE